MAARRRMRDRTRQIKQSRTKKLRKVLMKERERHREREGEESRGHIIKETKRPEEAQQRNYVRERERERERETEVCGSADNHLS